MPQLPSLVNQYVRYLGGKYFCGGYTYYNQPGYDGKLLLYYILVDEDGEVSEHIDTYVHPWEENGQAQIAA